MMKTPEEIKQAMEICTSEVCPNDGRCPYAELNCCADVMTEDGLAYIQQLEVTVDFYCNTTQMLDAKIAKLESRLAQVERERDALMEYAKGCCETCAFVGDCAKHDPDPTSPGAWWYDDCEEWQWRGVCEENTKEEK